MVYVKKGIRKQGEERKDPFEKETKAKYERNPVTEKMGRSKVYLEILSKEGLEVEGAVKHCFARVIKVAPTVHIYREGQLVLIDVFDYPDKIVNDENLGPIKCKEVREGDIMAAVPWSYWRIKDTGVKK